MSASTVSITANPATRRKSTVIAAEMKSNAAIEFLSNGADPNNNVVLSSDRHSKDLSHHSILERTSKDVKKTTTTTAFANSTVSPRRSRKLSSKNDKPRWQTVLSVLTKNFVLLIALIGFVQMVRSAFMKSGGDYPPMGTQMAALSESEARIAEVESLLKNSVKMIQVQVEVVNKKIESEVGRVRTEIDDKIVILETELKQLAATSHVIERSLGELEAVEWLSKEDFNKFIEEFQKKQKGAAGVHNDDDLSLDDIRAYARDIVLKEIEKHASDGLGKVDYALASGGGMVVKHSDPFSIGKLRNWLLTTTHGRVHPDADKVLKPSFGEPGQCFPLKGSTGFVQIKLRAPVIPEAVTLEHVAKGVAYDRSSAPKNCWVSGWLQGQDMDTTVDKQGIVHLTEFTYDLEKSNAQTFNVLESATSTVVDTIRLDFTSNHGNPSHTCIYRFRVHGYEPDSVSVMAMES